MAKIEFNVPDDCLLVDVRVLASHFVVMLEHAGEYKSRFNVRSGMGQTLQEATDKAADSLREAIASGAFNRKPYPAEKPAKPYEPFNLDFI